MLVDVAPPPLDRRLQFVVGKGGVGKTTIAAALATMLAAHGRRVLAVEMDAAGRLPGLLGGSGAALRPTEVQPGLSVLTVEGRAALEEYLALIIPVRRLLQTVFQSRLYQYFVAAAPGLKELMTVGKIWYEATRLDDGHPAWDTIVVDAPATGHSLQVLRMPQAARDTFGAGLVQREAARIVDYLQDPRTTAVHLVTLAEEMPVAEALEARVELTEHLRLPLAGVIVNRLHRRAFAPALLARLREGSQRLPERERALAEAVAARGAEESSWAEINRQYLERLRAETGGMPIIELPFLFVEEFDGRALGHLAAALGEQVLPAVAARARRST